LNNLQSGPEKIAQSLMCRYFATICSRITRFHQNAQKRAFCQSMQIYISWWKFLWQTAGIGFML